MRFLEGTLLVAHRELSERIRQRSFLISTGVTLLIVAAAGILPGVLGGGPETYKVGAVGAEQKAVAAAAKAAAPDLDAKIEVERPADRAAAQRAVKSGDLDAALVGARTVVFDDELPDELKQALQVGSRQVATGVALRKQGLSASETRAALDPPALRSKPLSGSEEDKDQKRFIALAAGLLLYGQLLTYGLWVSTGVVEEKSSRVVEILLSTLSARSLMAGKILGLGVLGMGQMLLTVVVGLGLALATGSLDPNASDIAPVLLVLLWFPLGYALYATLYAAAGAIVSRQEDLQSSTTPLTILIIASFFISFTAINDPGGALATVASIVPFSSPLVMPGRMALGDASFAEVVAAIVVLLATTVVLIRVSAQIYSAGLLRTGKPLKVLEAFKASK